MTDPKCILPPTQVINTREAVRALIEPIYQNIFYFDSVVEPNREMYKNAKLIIVSSEPEQVSTLLNQTDLPELTPILVLGIESAPPDFLVYRGKARFIDYLVLPVSQDLLFHKIYFLQQVQTVAVEHHTNTTILSKQLNALLTRDGLTGLLNRRQLTINLLQEFQAAQEHGTELCLLIFNIDNFNKINKAAGLQFGDFILNEISARLTLSTRKIDSCYRFSGEDFIVLIPGTTLQDARQTAKKIRKACSGKPFNDGLKKQSVTISLGVASLQTHEPATGDEFISMAETALFMAKAEGRNRVQIFSHKGDSGEYSPQKSFAVLKETLNRILAKTKVSAISSLQLLTRNVVGPEHQNHITTVSSYVTLLGKQLNLPEYHITTFQNAVTLFSSIRFLLHNDLISKPEKFTNIERNIINDLPVKLTEITDMFDYFANERTILRCYNERYDGTGKPHGLKGDEIPLGSRLFNIIDSLAAMSSERPFRKKLAPRKIISELIKEAGKQFDPTLVLQILTLIEEKKLLELEPNLLNFARQNLFNTFPQLKI